MATTPTLAGCVEKWARGTALINRLIEMVDEYVNDESGPPHRAHGVFVPARKAYVVEGELLRPMDDALMWAVILGDAMHNLRSALDHLVWQLVLLDTGKDGSNANQFPIASYGGQYWKPKKDGEPSPRDRQLAGLSDAHKEMIDVVQPYRLRGYPNNQGKMEPLGVLRDLSNHDKHRLLHVLLFAIDVQHTTDFRLIPNPDAGDQLGTTLKPFSSDGPTEIMVTDFSCPGPQPWVDSEGDFTISPGVEYARLRLPDLPTLGDAVQAILDRFEPEFR